MMTVIPKRLNRNDEKQGAYLRATIVRVRLPLYIYQYFIWFQLTKKTGLDQEAIFFLRPLFYKNSENKIMTKYWLLSANFIVRYETYLNPFHPSFQSMTPFAERTIFDVAKIIKKIRRKNASETIFNLFRVNKLFVFTKVDSIVLVATAEVGSQHVMHTMALDCVLVDVKANGKYENYKFKFKNT